VPDGEVHWHVVATFSQHPLAKKEQEKKKHKGVEGLLKKAEKEQEAKQ
jgi:hypothetical protein